MPNNSFDSPPAAQTGAQGVVPDHSPSPDPVAVPVPNAGVAVNLAGIIAAVAQPQPGTPFGNSLIPYGTPAQRVSEDL